jgi:hypothetical protein
VRELNDASVCATNHFETRLNHGGAGWRPRPIDSAGRIAAARALAEPDFAADFAWFKPPIANINSRLAFNADAANGTLTLIGTNGAAPATQVFRLPSRTPSSRQRRAGSGYC